MLNIKKAVVRPRNVKLNKREATMKRVLALFIAAIMLLSLAACGNDPTPTQPQGNPTQGETQQGATEAPKEYKEEVIFGADVKIETLDPQEKSDGGHGMIFLMTHEPLVYYNENDQVFVNKLAERYENSSDSKTYTFYLRKGVKFHDGSELTADDVIFTFERGLNNATSSSSVKDLFKKMESWKKIDDYTVSFTLKIPNGNFLIGMSNFGSFGILSKSACEKDEAKGASIGTGPWKHKEFVAGDYLLLERFEDYWGEKPITKYFRSRYIPEGAARLMALENGEIDICSKVAVEDTADVEANPKLDQFVYYGALTYLFFNFDHAPFDDVNFRLAVLWALDLDEINAGVLGGGARIATSRVAPYEFGYFDDFASTGRDNYGKQNVQKAKEYLAKSKYAGQDIKFDIAVNNAERELIGQLIQAQLKTVLGVTVSVTKYDTAGFTAVQKERSWDGLIASIGYTAEGDDIRRSYDTGAGQNKMNYSNPQVDELFDKALIEQDKTKSQEYYKQIQCILYDDCPTVPMFFAGNSLAYTKKLIGVEWVDRGYSLYSYVKVEK